MALFKPVKGNSANLPTFHDGYAYLCTDNGAFYIDALDGSGAQKRFHINPEGGGSEAINATLLASGWSNGQQILSVAKVTSESNGIMGVTQDISAAQREAAKNGELYICGQSDGQIIVATDGTVPAIDIPIVIILM